MSNRPKPPRKAARSRRRFDPEFKYEAVKLAKQVGFKKAAEDLGIKRSPCSTRAKRVSLRYRYQAAARRVNSTGGRHH